MARITLNQLLPLIIRKHTTIATINAQVRGIRLHPAEDQIILNLQITVQIIPRLQTITLLVPRIITLIPLLREVLHRVRVVVILHLPEVPQEAAVRRQAHRAVVVQAVVAQAVVAAVIVNPTLIQY